MKKEKKKKEENIEKAASLIRENLYDGAELTAYKMWQETGISEQTFGNYKKGGMPTPANARTIIEYFEKNKNVQKIGDVSGVSGESVIGAANVSGSTINLNTNGNKDKIIEKQEERVGRSYDVLVSELQRFHEISVKKDESIAKIVSESFHRNERNMDRIDGCMRRADDNARRIDELIQIIQKQNESIKERADKILSMMGNIMSILTDKLIKK